MLRAHLKILNCYQNSLINNFDVVLHLLIEIVIYWLDR